MLLCFLVFLRWRAIYKDTHYHYLFSVSYWRSSVARCRVGHCKWVPRPNSNFVCVCVDFPTPASNSQMPARCLRIQLNSDTFYLEIESDSRGKEFSSTGQPSTLDASHKPRLLSVHLTNLLQTGVSNRHPLT